MPIETQLPANSNKSWLREHAAKFPALLFWAALIIGYQWYVSANNLTPLQAVQTLLDFFANSLWGMLIYVVVYAIRPLILFPATLITLAAGFVYGPFIGVLMVVVASNISSSIAYLVGRFFGQGLFAEGQGDGWVARYTRRMRQNSFETILTMRFIFLPYDAVSYLAGFLKIRYWPFILATALGSIPGTIAFVGFGASIETFDGAIPQLNPLTLGFSIAIFIISLVLSRVFKKREVEKPVVE
jgi:uncharacterized membrane protein YdjX (TVP38/TMEM64 family)